MSAASSNSLSSNYEFKQRSSTASSIENVVLQQEKEQQLVQQQLEQLHLREMPTPPIPPLRFAAQTGGPIISRTCSEKVQPSRPREISQIQRASWGRHTTS